MEILFRKYIHIYTCAWVAKKREDFSSSSSPMRNSILAKIPEQTKQAISCCCKFDFHTIFSDLIDSLPLPTPLTPHNNGFFIEIGFLTQSTSSFTVTNFARKVSIDFSFMNLPSSFSFVRMTLSKILSSILPAVPSVDIYD